MKEKNMTLASLKNMSDDPSDKRYLPRWKVKNVVTYQIEDRPQTHKGITNDLSCCGTCIATETPLEPHQKVLLTIRLAEETLLSLHGSVAWINRASGEPTVGIQFINISTHAQECLLQHAFELNRKGFQKHWFKGWDGSQ